ncbi:MAG: C-terminal binding protein [Gammaproteobacteria bacterium]|nr:C-terminal binding protein [Gammaproteobacteria bacterium]
MTTLKVALTDTVFPSLEPATKILDALGAALVQAKSPMKDAILEVARDADAVMVTYAKIDAEIIAGLDRCRVIGRFGIGVDNIDLAAATKAGIQVVFCPDYCLDEVSDHALALLIALVRKIPLGNTLAQSGRWEMKAMVPMRRLRGRTLGLVGFGKIPQRLVPKAQAFGLAVIAYDPYVPQDVLDTLGVGRVDFDALLQHSDLISVHAPLTAETRHLFGAATFKRMKPEALIVNTARGPLIDEAALVAALDAGEISGAALDVIESEPSSPDSPLLGRDNVILTPHAAFYSEEALLELQTKVAEDVVSVLKGEAPRYPANRL